MTTVLRGIYRGLTPKITWGTSFANTIVFDRALDQAQCFSVEMATQTVVRNPTGDDMDGWSYGYMGVLTGKVRRIPRVDLNGKTGWEGTAGWNAFLISVGDAQVFRFYPDATTGTYWTCLGYEQEREPDEEINRMRTLLLSIRKVDLSVFVGY